jgi:UDP-N-acetylglucosamine 2-epimerase (non-hydrolysing)
VKILTVFGTRPEIIRLSLIIKELDRFGEQTLLHTGQNYDQNLSDVFFRELELRPADRHLGVQTGSFPEQLGQIAVGVDRAIDEVEPDRILILGDTNSGLAAIVAARRGVPVFHMEAGNRCYDDRVPEEVNRRIIDHSSTVLMPYTQRSKENLVREGIERERIFVIGNPIFEVLEAHRAQVAASDALTRLGVRAGEYFLVTLHRAENVDDPDRLRGFVEALDRVAERWRQPLIVSLHPRTADKLARFGIGPRSDMVRAMQPLGFFDFVALERQARCAISDSGTVQEECCIFRVPNVTIRDTTERPETIECGSNILTGADPDRILAAVEMVLATPADWTPPPEYLEPRVSRTVARIVLGYRWDPRRERTRQRSP